MNVFAEEQRALWAAAKTEIASMRIENDALKAEVERLTAKVTEVASAAEKAMSSAAAVAASVNRNRAALIAVLRQIHEHSKADGNPEILGAMAAKALAEFAP